MPVPHRPAVLSAVWVRDRRCSVVCHVQRRQDLCVRSVQSPLDISQPPPHPHPHPLLILFSVPISLPLVIALGIHGRSLSPCMWVGGYGGSGCLSPPPRSSISSPGSKCHMQRRQGLCVWVRLGRTCMHSWPKTWHPPLLYVSLSSLFLPLIPPIRLANLSLALRACVRTCVCVCVPMCMRPFLVLMAPHTPLTDVLTHKHSLLRLHRQRLPSRPSPGPPGCGCGP